MLMPVCLRYRCLTWYECASKWNNIKSYKRVAVEAFLKNGNFHCVKYRRY